MMTSMAAATTRAADLEASFFDLYARESTIVLRYFRSALGDLATAEDLSADTFCRAWDGWARFNGDAHLARAWLMRIARNRLIDHARKNKRMAFVALVGSEPSGTSGTEATAVDRVAMQTALASLGVDDRDLLAMRLAGLSHAEIGAVRKQSEAAVKKAWQRALLKLRPQLEVYR
jgi:RNA polymerase sigma-70 factor (ECF subfamily)